MSVHDVVVYAYNAATTTTTLRCIQVEDAPDGSTAVAYAEAFISSEGGICVGLRSCIYTENRLTC